METSFEMETSMLRKEAEAIGERRGEKRGKKIGERQGEERGEKNAKLEIASRLLKEGLSLDFIMNTTKLTEAQIRHYIQLNT